MRTAMPLVTCCRITDCSESAMEVSISTSRLIGPGMHQDGRLLGQGEDARG